MKRQDRATHIDRAHKMRQKWQERTRQSIQRDCEGWAADRDLTDPQWTNDTYVTGYTGKYPNGDILIYYFSVVDVPGFGPEILQIRRIVTALERKHAEGSDISPYLYISAQAFNLIHQAVVDARHGKLPKAA